MSCFVLHFKFRDKNARVRTKQSAVRDDTKAAANRCLKHVEFYLLDVRAALPYKNVITTYYNGRNADGLLTEADWQIFQYTIS